MKPIFGQVKTKNLQDEMQQDAAKIFSKPDR
jgi:hypothetical protein